MDGDTSLLMPFEGSKIPRYYFAAVGCYFGASSIGFVLGYTATALPGLQTMGTQLTVTVSFIITGGFAISKGTRGRRAGGFYGGSILSEC